MNDLHESIPVAIARDVLDDYEHMDDWNKPRTRSGKEMPPHKVTLARAVLRMEALAERLERESGILRDLGDYPNESGAMAARLRTVLKGDPHA